MKNAGYLEKIKASGVSESRGLENRTPTKGFGDPYHTI